MIFVLPFVYFSSIVSSVDARALPRSYLTQRQVINADQPPASSTNATISTLNVRQDNQKYVFMHHVRPLRSLNLLLLTSDLFRLLEVR
jgi:hypothetical protein